MASVTGLAFTTAVVKLKTIIETTIETFNNNNKKQKKTNEAQWESRSQLGS